MDAKKIVGLIFSVLFIGAFAFVLSWGITNFNKVQEGISGTGLYNEEDLNNAYQDGYDTALTNKDEYDELINGYRDTITTLNDNISQLNSQILTLKNNNQDCQNQINNLTTTKIELEKEIVRLNENKVTNEGTIDNLNKQIVSLNSQITNLNNTINSNKTTINSLNNQIIGLNTQIAGLNQTITTNEKTISDLRVNINELNSEIEKLVKNNNENDTEINLLNSRIVSLTEQIVSLNNQNKSLLETITSLENEIVELTDEKNILIIENTNYYNAISSLNNQIVNLQNINTQLENTNTLHLNTIASLNTQIANLNQQISDITYQSQNNNLTISSLNSKIKELEESIQYYESYISNLENDEQVVATFEYNGSVYNIQIVNKGSTVAVSTPSDTPYLVFNGWTIDGEFVDLSSYAITQNTKIVADITYKYDVVFKVDNIVYDTQIVVKNECVDLPNIPTKTGYIFEGWSIDGVTLIENIDSLQVLNNTTYHAVFSKLYTVEFVYEDTIKSTQSVKNGMYATSVNVENTLYKVFNGWKVNGSIVDVSTYKITSDTTFVADITYKYDVVYKVDDNNYDTQIVTLNNYPTLPVNPSKEGYVFEGWSLNGVDIVNTSTIQITNNTTYYAVFTKLYTVSFVYEDSTISVQSVKENEFAKAINVNNTAYKVFNGWKVNNNFVNISNYVITQDTEFIADITYNYDVVFMVDNNIYNSQIVVENGYATLPNNPSKSGYDFDGWTLNGVNVIEPNNTKITNNTTFIAKFTKLHTVKFMYENQVYATQTVRNNECAENISISDTEDKIFTGWTLNGSVVSVSSKKILADTTFVAQITYKYKVTFMSNSQVFKTQYVTENTSASMSLTPTLSGYNFVGWSLNGTDVISLSSYTIKQETTFIAVFEEIRSYLESGSALNSKIGTDVTSVVFDKFTNTTSKTYVVNGTNVISGITAVDVSNSTSDGKVELYKVGTVAYVLSSYDIYTTACYKMFDYCTSLISVKFNNFNTSETTNMSYMFNFCMSLASLDVSCFDTSKVTTFENMFAECRALKSLNVSNFNTSSAKNMRCMFSGLKTVSSLNLSNFDTSNVTRMDSMFTSSAIASLNLSNFDTSKVQHMTQMFAYMSSLTYLDISSFNTSNVLRMDSMFVNCSKLTNLDVNHFDTSKVTDMASMFSGMQSITTLDLRGFNTASLTNMNSMFDSMTNLVQVDLSSFNTQNVTSMHSTFRSCEKLTTIYVGNGWTTANVTTSSQMFYYAVKLPNYNASYVDVSKAYVGSGGYLTYKAS